MQMLIVSSIVLYIAYGLRTKSIFKPRMTKTKFKHFSHFMIYQNYFIHHFNIFVVFLDTVKKIEHIFRFLTTLQEETLLQV
jgi:hypothetical protein